MKVLLTSPASSIHTQRWMTALTRRGHEVHLATVHGGKPMDGTVHYLPIFGLGKAGYFAAIPALRKVVKRLKPDVVHAHYLSSYGFLTAAAKVSSFVGTAWGSDVLITPQQSQIARILTSYGIKRAAAITVVAEHMSPAVLKLGAVKERLHVIPFGVDTSIFQFRTAPFDTDFIRIVSTRNLKPIYDIPTVLRAVNILKERGVLKRFHLDLAGSGELKEELEVLAEKLGIKEEVTFHGRVEQLKAAELLARADLFVSSALSDGNNISLNEAMACGSIPVGTDIPANSAWITHGVNGFLYSSGKPDALAASLEMALGKRDLWPAIAKQNRDQVTKEASWDLCVDKTCALYEQLAGKRDEP
ncbi:MAG: glycosyltransferase family 4 protein [Verrucomicrobiota bacterium]|nr:glycosyltransferase family 4 protein [Verrucomicrobiota bacterium]